MENHFVAFKELIWGGQFSKSELDHISFGCHNGVCLATLGISGGVSPRESLSGTKKLKHTIASQITVFVDWNFLAVPKFTLRDKLIPIALLQMVQYSSHVMPSMDERP